MSERYFVVELGEATIVGCRDCAALVIDQAIHDAWHGDGVIVDPLPPPDAEGDQLANPDMPEGTEGWTTGARNDGRDGGEA